MVRLDLAMACLLKRVLWKFVLVDSGEVYVTATTGMTKMRLLSVENWDIQQLVTNNTTLSL